MLRVEFFEAAGDEIEFERGYYREHSITAEAAFLRELDHAISVVSEAPLRWPLHTQNTRRYVFPSFPFSLVYIAENDVIVVVALESHSKRPGYWHQRLR